jgi:hypothetical protein
METDDALILGAVAVFGYLGFSKIQEAIDGISGGSSSVISSYVEKSVEKSSAVSDIFMPDTYFAEQNKDIYTEPENQTSGGTTGQGGTFDFLTKGPIGSGFVAVDKFGRWLNPMPADLQETQRVYGSGNVTTSTVAAPNSLYNRLFGAKSETTVRGPASTKQESKRQESKRVTTDQIQRQVNNASAMAAKMVEAKRTGQGLYRTSNAGIKYDVKVRT